MEAKEELLNQVAKSPFKESTKENRRKQKARETSQEVINTTKENLIYYHFINKVSCSVEIVCEDKSTIFVHFPILPVC